MCAEFKLRAKKSDLEELLKVALDLQTSADHWSEHVRLYGLTPVILKRRGRFTVEDMHFSLLPPGGRIPFTANTRLDDWEHEHLKFAYERPTWREALLKRRCVIPASQFLEPIYEGPHAGKMLGFFSPEQPVLFIAGIYQETADTKTGEVYSGFSMMTDFAHAFVREMGHHRTVITLAPADAARWIKEEPVDGRAAVRFLLKHNQTLHLDFAVEREMKNWKSRVADAERKNASEDKIRPLVEAERRRLGLIESSST